MLVPFFRTINFKKWNKTWGESQNTLSTASEKECLAMFMLVFDIKKRITNKKSATKMERASFIEDFSELINVVELGVWLKVIATE